MKHNRTIILILALALLLVGTAGCADVIYGPGLYRSEAAVAYEQAEALAEQLGIGLTDGAPLYKPANAQPLNAYLVVDPQCEVGIDRDDMYPVSEKGLVPEITACLEQWIGDIQSASGGVIRFVADPNDADVLVSACQSYKLYGTYSGGGMTAEGYACTVTLKAWQLTNTGNTASFTAIRVPDDTVTLRGGGKFWKVAPDLTETDQLNEFVTAIMTWYGFGAQRGSKGAGVRAVQSSLIRRSFLGGSADGDFGPRTEAAVMAMQEAYSLPKTGIVDGKTLVGVFYDHAAVDALS